MTLTATQERDAGMAQALGHAESVEPGWGDTAAMELLRYCKGMSGGKFISDEFINWFQSHGLTMPPTNKAFGPVFTKAAKNGLIRKVGYRPHPLRHASPTVLWEVV